MSKYNIRNIRYRIIIGLEPSFVQWCNDNKSYHQLNDIINGTLYIDCLYAIYKLTEKEPKYSST